MLPSLTSTSLCFLWLVKWSFPQVVVGLPILYLFLFLYVLHMHIEYMNKYVNYIYILNYKILQASQDDHAYMYIHTTIRTPCDIPTCLSISS